MGFKDDFEDDDGIDHHESVLHSRKMILMMGPMEDDIEEGFKDDDGKVHLEKVLHSEPTSITRSPTTKPHSEQIWKRVSTMILGRIMVMKMRMVIFM